MIGHVEGNMLEYIELTKVFCNGLKGMWFNIHPTPTLTFQANGAT
jgi:hypothetical protein